MQFAGAGWGGSRATERVCNVHRSPSPYTGMPKIDRAFRSYFIPEIGPRGGAGVPPAPPRASYLTLLLLLGRHRTLFSRGRAVSTTIHILLYIPTPHAAQPQPEPLAHAQAARGQRPEQAHPTRESAAGPPSRPEPASSFAASPASASELSRAHLTHKRRSAGGRVAAAAQTATSRPLSPTQAGLG